MPSWFGVQAPLGASVPLPAGASTPGIPPSVPAAAHVPSALQKFDGQSLSCWQDCSVVAPPHPAKVTAMLQCNAKIAARGVDIASTLRPGPLRVNPHFALQQNEALRCSTPPDYGPVVAATLIKKYGNRRLYDTGDSRYVTLDELAAKVRSGIDTRVVDAQTGEDLTQATLTQIVLETGNAAKFLPVQLLNQMIRLSDDSLAEFFSRYVTGALDIYLQAKRGAQTLSQYNPLMWMGNMGGMNPFGQPFAQPSFAASPAGIPYSSAPPPPPPHHEPPDGEPTPPTSHAATGEDVASMRRELDELKQAIREGLAPRASAGGKSRKKKS